MGITFGDVLLFGLMMVSLFLMFVILLQRGRGGGLAGAFGGLGGQSAFGTKAGDVFTVITVVTVIIWVILACVAGARLRYENSPEFRFQGAVAPPAGAGANDAADQKGAPLDDKEKGGGADEGAPAGDEKSNPAPEKQKNAESSGDAPKLDSDAPEEKGAKTGSKPGTDSKDAGGDDKPD